MEEDFFKIAQDRLKFAKTAWSEIHQSFVDDIDFVFGNNQWDAQTINARNNQNRTSYTFNKIAPLARNITNTALKNPPAIKVIAKKTGSKTLQKIYEGLVKHIQSESNATAIYNDTMKEAVVGGLGVFEVIIDENYSGEKCIKLKRITDPTLVYPDPSAQNSDLSDMKWLFHMKTITKAEFDALYPDIETSELDARNKEWFGPDSVTIAEYWTVNDDGTVSWHILNGAEVIDSSDWYDEKYPGKYIPYCFILGEEYWLENCRKIKSIVTDIKDAQKMLNYMQSEAIDYVSKIAKSPYIGSDASVGPYKEVWENANRNNYAFLPYVDGKTPPQRNDPPQIPIGFVDSVTRLENDIRTSVGVRDPLQDIPAGQSGKAINLQLAESNVNTFLWIDHTHRAIKYAGKVIVDLIPFYYNYPHIQQIIGIDGQSTQVGIMTPNMQTGEYIDLTADEYAVDISTGPSYETQREATRDAILELAKVNPQILQVAGDILIRNMDFAESNEISDRLATLLPPQIQAIAGQNNPDFNIKMQMMQMSQQLQQANQMIQQLTNTLNVKNAEVDNLKRGEQTKMMIANQNNQVELQKEQMSNRNDAITAQIKAEADIQKQHIESAADIRIKELEAQIEIIKADANRPSITIAAI